jgi:ribosomal protein S18 acetylase RimI-like enzyme
MRYDFFARPATKNDQSALAKFINAAPRVHRHLDWCAPLDWLGKEPFWILDSDQGIQSVLAFPEDPPGTAWIRIFACAAGVSASECWEMLYPLCRQSFRKEPEPIIAALGLSEWFNGVLERNHFSVFHNIVSLSRDAQDPYPDLHSNPDVFVRLMEPDDLSIVAAIDQTAFQPIWQNSRAQIDVSYEQALYATVAEIKDQVVGYQISTSSLFSAHLARLAVDPLHQHQQIAATLLIDLFQKFRNDRLWEITVNTQDTNHRSLALYKKAGFKLTGEQYPVYTSENHLR